MPTQSLTEILSSLTTVETGKDIFEVVTAARLNAIQDAIKGLARCDNINAGPGLRKRTGTGWVTFVADKYRSNPGASDPDIAFFLSDATTSEGDPPEESNKVLVADGKINGAFPAGMPSGNFIIDVEDPADCIIYAEITFDAETLEITSREINHSTAAGIPESGIDGGTGSFIVMLGFTYFDSDDDWRIINTHLGNIEFQLVQGDNAGKPSMLAVPVYSPWMDIPES